MANYYDDANPVIENGKLILVSKGGSKQYIGISAARKQLADLEGKTNLSESSIARRDVLRKAVALWDAWSSR